MDHETLLKEYCRGSELLRAKMEEVDDAMLAYRPDIADAWTIKEHAIHVVDSEINGFLRLKSIIAQPGTHCYVMDEETWTKNIRRKSEDVGKYLAVYALVKEMVYDLLVDEDPGNWDKDYFIRDYKGRRSEVNIEKCLQIYIDHLRAHLEYIDRNMAAYKRDRPGSDSTTTSETDGLDFRP